MQRRDLLRLILSFGLLSWAFRSGVSAADAPALRYAFEAGQVYTYDVSIQIDMPEAQLKLAGLSRYEVKSVDASTGQITLTHSAELGQSWGAVKSARGFGMAARAPFSFSSYNTPCQIVIDPNGKIVRYERKSQLPCLLGNVWALAIEPLPASGNKTWQSRRQMEIADQETSGWFPHPMSRKPVNWSATETIDYSIQDPAVEPLAITRTYLMATTEQIDDEPVFSLKGQGKITFASKAGLIQAIEEKQTLRVTDSGVTVKIPITTTATLLSPAEAQKKSADRKAAADEARRAAEEAQKPKPIDGGGLDQLLAAIRSSNASQRRQNLEKLARSIPIEERRDEVAAVLVDLLGEKDHWTVTGAEKALKVWGNDQCTPALIERLTDGDVFVRQGAIDALAPRKSAAAAEAVAGQLVAQDVRHQASQALKAMGDVAEKPILPMLKNPEWTVRMSACEILAAVGTPQSIEALKSAANDTNGLVKQKATDALKAIEARAGQKQ